MNSNSHTADALREILATCADPLNRACEEYAKLERELAETNERLSRAMRNHGEQLMALHAQRSETRPTRFRLSGGYELWKNPAYPSDNKPWELLSETGAHIRYLDENEAQFVDGALSARAAVDTSAPCNVEGPAHLCPKPAPGFELDKRGVLVATDRGPSAPCVETGTSSTANSERRSSLEYSELKPDEKQRRSGEADRESGSGDNGARSAAVGAGRIECGARSAGGKADEVIESGAVSFDAAPCVAPAPIPTEDVLWEIRQELAALVSDPNNPDWMPALKNGNPADAECLNRAYELTGRGSESSAPCVADASLREFVRISVLGRGDVPMDVREAADGLLKTQKVAPTSGPSADTRLLQVIRYELQRVLMGAPFDRERWSLHLEALRVRLANKTDERKEP